MPEFRELVLSTEATPGIGRLRPPSVTGEENAFVKVEKCTDFKTGRRRRSEIIGRGTLESRWKRRTEHSTDINSHIKKKKKKPRSKSI